MALFKQARVVVPVVLGVLTLLIFGYLHTHPPEAEMQPVKKRIQTAKVQLITPSVLTFQIETQGIVRPTHLVSLRFQTSGKLTWLNPKLLNGGVFERDEHLATLDDAAAKKQVALAEAKLLNAKQQLKMIQAEMQSEQALLKALSGQVSDTLPLFPKARYQKKLTELNSHIKAAEQDLKWAQQHLKRTRLTADFQGRAQTLFVNEGQDVTAGFEIARLYTIDRYQITFHLTDRQLRLLPNDLSNMDPIQVFGTQDRMYMAQPIGNQTAIDSVSQLHQLICEISVKVTPNSTKDRLLAETRLEEPLSAGALLVGQRVRARLMSRKFENAIALPREAVFQDQAIWWVDQQDQLRRQLVDVIYKTVGDIYVQSDWQAQQRVIIQPLAYHLEGMHVIAEQVEQP